jgi:hypothetical protein
MRISLCHAIEQIGALHETSKRVAHSSLQRKMIRRVLVGMPSKDIPHERYWTYSSPSSRRFGGVMSIRATVSICIAVTIIAASVWVLTPPFPAPEALITRPYSDLLVALGPPVGSIPTKFVAWQKSRGIAIWTLEAGYGMAPINQRATPGRVSRCLWIDWAGVSILCRRAVMGKSR